MGGLMITIVNNKYYNLLVKRLDGDRKEKLFRLMQRLSEIFGGKITAEVIRGRDNVAYLLLVIKCSNVSYQEASYLLEKSRELLVQVDPGKELDFVCFAVGFES